MTARVRAARGVSPDPAAMAFRDRGHRPSMLGSGVPEEVQFLSILGEAAIA